ncbi:hypothetical protein [Streptomyces sp. NPDC054783]
MALTGTVLGFAAAFSVPTGFSWHKDQPWYAITFSLLYGTFMVTPSGITYKEWIAVVCVALASASFALLCKPKSWKPPNPRSKWKTLRSKWSQKTQPKRAQYAAAALGVFSILLPMGLGIASISHAIRHAVVDDGRSSTVISGLLIAVFGCQQIIGRIVRPFVEKIREKISAEEFEEDVEDFIKVGPHVGWIERFILFSFLVSGNPAPAALVVTAKSLARFPELQQAEKIVGDYYLVGTLTSVAVALVTSGVTRMALGMPPI